VCNHWCIGLLKRVIGAKYKGSVAGKLTSP
jgi:hypothetical protein